MSTRIRTRLCRRFLLCISLAVSSAFVVPAHAFVPAPLFPPSQISLRVLPNGVRSIVKEAHGSGVVAVQVWVRAGSRHEFADQGGAAHLLGVACLHASSGYSLQSGGATNAIRGLGGTAFSQTARDSTNFGATVAQPFAENAVRILADAVLHPDLSDAALAEDKNIARGNIQARESDALATASDLSYQAAFKAHPYRRSPLGQIADLATLETSKLRAFEIERYTGANISVVVSGDISTERAQTLVARYFAQAPRALPNARTQFGTPENGSPGAALGGSVIRRTGNVARPAIALSFRAPGIDAPADVVAMDVLISHWNEGSDAVLRRALLGNPEANNSTPSSTGNAEAPDADATPDTTPNPTPPAVALDIAFLTQRDPSLVTFSMVTEPDQSARAVRTLFGEIARVQKNSITPFQLERAKRALRRQFIEQDETAAGQAGALGFYDMIGSYDFGATYLDRINRVTLADIKRVSTKYFALTSPLAILIQPEPKPQTSQNPDDNGVNA